MTVLKNKLMIFVSLLSVLQKKGYEKFQFSLSENQINQDVSKLFDDSKNLNRKYLGHIVRMQ